MTLPPLTVSATLDAAPRFVFDVFTARLGDFWPLSYTFSGPDFADARIDLRDALKARYEAAKAAAMQHVD